MGKGKGGEGEGRGGGEEVFFLGKKPYSKLTLKKILSDSNRILD